MPLESATYISDLNTSNPVGSTDKVQTLDDHVRLIKSTLKTTFPSVTGAVTPAHTAINQTCVGTGGTFPAINGSALTALNASNLASGTVPDARFPATLPAASGANLTALNASNLASGTAPDARLSSNVALKNGVNEMTSAGNGTASASAIYLNSARPQIGWRDSGGGSNAKIWLQQALSNIFDIVQLLNDAEGGAKIGIRATRSGASITAFQFGETADSPTFTFNGPVASPNTSASEVGFKGAPSVDISSSTNSNSAFAGITVRMTGGSGQTLTLDADPPEDSVVILDNASGNSWTIAASSSLVWAATGGTGSRTLANNGMAVALHRGSGVWIINGGGLT